MSDWEATMPELTHMSFAIDDGIATVTFDKSGEAMNTLDPSLMGDFETILDRLESDPEVKAVVINSAKSDSFVTGANIKWFSELDNPLSAQTAIEAGQGLFDRLERLHRDRAKPVVATIHGACLGGGLELALACSHRVASDDAKTQLGQPEVKLGLIPAGGGTQRLPKLIGVTAALDLILTGRSMRPSKARKLGLVDATPPLSHLHEVATETARQAIGSPSEKPDPGWLSASGLQKLALETNPLGQKVLFQQARQKLLKETKGNYPAPERALEAVRIGVQEGTEAGMAAEARFFAALVGSPESKALRSIFFATRAKPDTGGAKTVDTVGVLGGGLMGAGIATVSTQKAGARVRIKEVDQAGVARALAYVSGVLSGRVKRRRMGDFEAEQAMLRVTGTTDWSGFGAAELIIEAVFEDLALKQSLLKEVESVTGGEAVFASNTSSLPITEIAAASTRPGTVLGMHYFSPVEKMPLLEVIVTPETADWAEATAVEFGQRQGKTVIVVNDGTGFYTSRILGPYSTEAFHLLAEGASVEAIDSAVEAWGFPVGPLRLADEVGLDVGAKIGKIMVDAFGARMAPPEGVDLASTDRRGRKNGKGFYLYDAKGKRGGVDDSVYSDLGVTPDKEVPRREIQDRITLALINEAARCLEEGILRSAADGDIGAVMGIGFPPFRGGPFFWIDQVGAGEVVERLRALEARHGARFEPARILVEATAGDTKFR